MSSIQVTDILVKKYRIICTVKIEGDKYSNSAIKDKLLEIKPSLKKHSCKNANNEPLSSVLDTTSIPHILEHLIIDNQIQYRNNEEDDVSILGTTEWINEDEGIAKIEFSFYDDVTALKSINEAQNLLNSLISD